MNNNQSKLKTVIKSVIKEADDIFGSLGNAMNPNTPNSISPKVKKVSDNIKREYTNELDVLSNSECIAITEILIEFLSFQLKTFKGREVNSENLNISEGDSTEPLFVKQARKLVADDTYGKLTDPATGKKMTCDFGTAKLIVQMWDSISDETKSKLHKVSLPKLTGKLWSMASFKR